MEVQGTLSSTSILRWNVKFLQIKPLDSSIFKWQLCVNNVKAKLTTSKHKHTHTYIHAYTHTFMYICVCIYCYQFYKLGYTHTHSCYQCNLMGTNKTKWKHLPELQNNIYIFITRPLQRGLQSEKYFDALLPWLPNKFLLDVCQGWCASHVKKSLRAASSF